MAIGDKIFVADKQTLDAFEAKFDEFINGNHFVSFDTNNSHATHMILDISGKGILQYLKNQLASLNSVIVQIDGGVYQSFPLGSSQILTLSLSFETSLKISSPHSGSSIIAGYKLM